MHWCLIFPFTSGSICACSRTYWHKSIMHKNMLLPDFASWTLGRCPFEDDFPVGIHCVGRLGNRWLKMWFPDRRHQDIWQMLCPGNSWAFLMRCLTAEMMAGCVREDFLQHHLRPVIKILFTYSADHDWGDDKEINPWWLIMKGVVTNILFLELPQT